MRAAILALASLLVSNLARLMEWSVLSLSKFDEIFFPVFLCLTSRFLELRAVPIDADDVPVRCGRPRHRPCELSEPAADVEDSFAPFDPHRLERGVIEKIVEQRESPLLFGVGPVNVFAARLGHSVVSICGFGQLTSKITFHSSLVHFSRRGLRNAGAG